MNAATYRNLIYTYWLPAAIVAGLLYVIITVIAASISPVAGGLGTGLMVTAAVVSVCQAIGSLLLFPYLFTLVSRRLGATTKFDEMLGVTAISSVPTLLLLLLSMSGTPGDITVFLCSLISMGLFVYGLCQMNETPLLPTVGHTVTVWVILVLGAGLLSTALTALL